MWDQIPRVWGDGVTEGGRVCWHAFLSWCGSWKGLVWLKCELREGSPQWMGNDGHMLI